MQGIVHGGMRANAYRREVQMKPLGANYSQFIQSFFHHSIDAVSIIGMDGLIHYVNPTFESLYGLSAEEVIGKSLWTLWPENRTDFPYMAHQVLRDKPVTAYETERQTPDGRKVCVSLTISPIHDDHGETFGYLTVGRDITERKRMEQLLLQAEKLAVVGQLGAALAHEIRNPLTSIKGFIQFMNERPEKQEQYVQIIESELKRIDGIIEDFLMTARPQLSELQVGDLGNIIMQSIAVMEPQANMHNIEIVLEAVSPVYPLLCDQSKLKQVFVNLLKNSIESMAQGGRITVTIQSKESRHIVDIRDEGCGIPPHLLPQLGSPFYTTKEKGTGLGLTVSQKIIQQHQGQMMFESRLDGGTTVSVQLPIHLND